VTVCLLLFIPIRYLALPLSVAIATGIYFFVLGCWLLAGKLSLLTLPTSRIQSAARGLVEVSGRAAGSRTTLAPITREPCFLYRTTVWQQREDQKNAWEKVADETRHLPFFIEDSTGQLLIEARGADLDLPPRFRREFVVSLLDFNDVPPSVSVFLSRHGIALDRDLCIEERLVKAEDALFVVGTLSENPGVQERPSLPHNDVGTDTRDPVRDTFRRKLHNDDRHNPVRNNSSEKLPAPEVIRLTSGAAPSSTREMSQQAKITAALNRAGVAEPPAWSNAGLPHEGVAVEEQESVPPANLSVRSRSGVRLGEMRVCQAGPDEDHPESSDSCLMPPVVLMKRANDSTFVISFRSQKESVGALAWKSAAMICGGTALMLLGFYVLWTQMALL